MIREDCNQISKLNLFQRDNVVEMNCLTEMWVDGADLHLRSAPEPQSPYGGISSPCWFRARGHLGPRPAELPGLPCDRLGGARGRASGFFRQPRLHSRSVLSYASPVKTILSCNIVNRMNKMRKRFLIILKSKGFFRKINQYFRVEALIRTLRN